MTLLKEEFSAIQTTPCMQLKGGLFPLTTLQLLSCDLEALTEELQNKIAQAPNFFKNIPLVLDLWHLNKEILKEDQPATTPTTTIDPKITPEPQKSLDLDLQALRSILLQHNLIPIGIKNASPWQQQQAMTINLAILRSNSNFENYSRSLQPPKPVSTTPNRPEEQEMQAGEPKSPKNKLILAPVRSGQQIYAPDGDVTVIGSVSHGSELLADGNIHVYGALRGRALAGINNNPNVRIFCNSLEADLISIAGQFKISENIDPKFWKKSVQIYLNAGKLEISEFL